MGNETGDLLARPLLPVANEEDARATAHTLESYHPGQVSVLYVVEKADGAPNRISVEQSEEVAADSFAAVRSVFPDVDERVAYDRDVVSAVLEVADEISASAVVFRPRESSRLAKFLSGDRSLKLITRANRPIVTLPRQTKK
jgi:nucleotide-binding universal stress UspA family protein